MPLSDKYAQNEYGKVWRKARRKELRAEINAIRAKTFCAVCGEQPIDFHRKEHVEQPKWRIAELVKRAAPLVTIKAEIARCTPLCRRCHLERDGRMLNIQQKAEEHWNRRLTWNDVAAIRSSSKSHEELAIEFGVGGQQIRRIRKGERWK